ncbi:MAG TPA: cyanophycin synthetase, partial [Solirubrobacteraceae bacterium]|nr:cyanophycin synthetase [Solirubrobacteraceae bacterium]
RPASSGSSRRRPPSTPPARAPHLSEDQAEAHLRSLELFGMRFGLEKMRRMMTALGSPQRRYDTVHVLGTNGKTSTAQLTGAILHAHGLRTGLYTSPHLTSYRERVRIDGRELDGEEFADAIARAVWASQRVNRTLADDDHVTQFELLTAAALWEMARRSVGVAVVEAGLGGRYDATSVVRSRVTVLTNVALEHTRWLGPTIKDIAEEKLAVLRPRTTLALGAGLHPDARAVAERVAAERGARLLEVAPSELEVEGLAAAGRFQRENFALARLAATAYLDDAGIERSERAFAQAARATRVPGRMQLVSADPPTLLDGAHNPHAVAALADSLGDVLGERPLALVMGVLEDKDAAAMLERLLARSERAWFTAPPSPRALSPAALESRARQLRFEHATCEPDPRRALREAQAWARANCGAVLVTGSVYLVGELLGELASAQGAGSSERREESAR